MSGGQHEHGVTSNDPKQIKHPWHLWNFSWRERVMDPLRQLMFKMGEKMSNNFLASKNLDLFEEVEGTLNAHGTWASRVDVPISTL